MSRYYKDNLAEQVWEKYGGKCFACKTTENLNIHHILPLSRGGKNELDNMILVCQKCHMAVHHGQNANKYKTHDNDGRPRGKRDDKVFMDFIHAEITGAEAVELLGYKPSCKIRQMQNFKDFMRENGIKWIERPPYYSTIHFDDGRVEEWHRGSIMLRA